MVFLFSSVGNPLVLGQSQPPPAKVVIDSLEISDYPTHNLTFRYLSPSKPLLAPLSPDQVIVHENGIEIELEQITATYLGIHFSVVLNPNYDLGMADDQGITRFSRAVTALSELNSTLQSNTSNRFSLFINPDLAYPDLTSFSALIEAINGYEGNIRTMSSNLDSFDQAVAHLITLGDNQEKALLFITPSIQSQTVDRFEQIIDQARQAGIVAHVWMVANDEFKETAIGQKVIAAVESTGGSTSISDGSVGFPDPARLIQGFGYSFSANYTSEVRSTGTHQLVLSIKPFGELETLSEPLKFELQVEPIALEFLNLPAEMTIIKHESSGVTPDALPVEVALSFPDRHPREIISVELWVNGNREQVNLQPPYGSFVIDLTQFIDLDQIQLEAKVTDVLGLTGQTDQMMIPLIWDESEIDQSARDRLWSRVLIALPVALLLLIGILVKPWRKNRKIQQPVEVVSSQENQILPGNQDFLATFSRIETDNSPSPVKPHGITQEITLIGKDPSLAQWVIEDEALEPLHAELRILPGGLARITDFNTTSGTWVNYEKVSTRGVELKQGDLVKLGNHLYRYNPRTKI